MSTTETKTPLAQLAGAAYVRVSYDATNWVNVDAQAIRQAAQSHADMLEALEQGERELTAFFETYVVNGKGVDDGVSDVLRRMRKAIAKAKGGAAS